MVLDRLKVIIETDTSGLQQGVKQAQKSVEDFGNAASSASAEINTSMNKINLNKAKMELADEKIRLREIGKEAEVAAAELEALQAKFATLQARLNEKGSKGGAFVQLTAMEYEKTQAEIEEVRAKLDRINASYTAQQEKIALLTAQIDDMKGAMDAYEKAVKRAQKATGDMKAPTQGAGELKKEIDKADDSVKKLNNSASKTKSIFQGTIGTFLKFRLLRALWSTITNAIREGIQYLAVYDKKLGGICGYNKALSQIATSFEKLKMSVSITAAELATSLAPAISAVMTAVSYLVERLNEFIAMVQGKSSFTVVNPAYWKDYAEYVQESNSQLKETKTLISGFDEINKISSSQSLFSTDEPLTTEKDVNAFRSLLGLWPLALPLLKKLIDLFKKKNISLNDQSTATENDTNKLKDWIKNVDLGTVAAGALALAISGIGQIQLPQIQIDTGEAVEKLNQIRAKLIEIGQTVVQPAIQVLVSVLGIDTAIQAIKSFAEQVSQAFETIKTNVQTAFQTISQNVSTELGNAMTSVEQFISNIPTAMSNAVTSVETFISTVTASISTFVSSTISKISSWASQLSSTISSTLTSVSNKIATWASNAVSTVSGVISKISNGISSVGKTTTNTNSGSLTQSRYTATKTTQTTALPTTTANKTVSYKQTPANNRRATGNSNTQAKLGDANNLSSQQLKSIQTVAAWCEAHPAALAAAGLAVLGGQIAVAAAGAGASAMSAAKTAKIIDIAPYIEQNSSNVIDIVELLQKASGFANGGVIKKPTLGLVGEYACASSNPEIITPENKMREVVDSSNSELASVYVQVGRQIIQAIENKDMSVSIGDMEIGKACARANNSQKRMTGKALIA